MDLKKYIHSVPDFPIKDVLFRDISPLLKSSEALDFVAKKLIEKINFNEVDYIAGIESRGFILAMLLAAKTNKGFIPIRKAGKLPPPVVYEKYSLEYGQASLELNPGKGRIVILDDVLATGGTLLAAVSLAEKAGYQVLDVAVLINLTFLNNIEFNHQKIYSLIEY
ncbi:MAG: adenine phosphoribosyltransferase [Deltaproteobacteria bacterium]|jgi:adenine phosphoribosyltransferase|nr:adenine phosphoribosyltransferase [Deltaproteobacteria bacterium]